MLTVEIREDRTGPGERGYAYKGECGCIMSKVCDVLRLHRSEQYEATISGRAKEPALYDALVPHGAPTDTSEFWRTVVTVQNQQDRAWHALCEGRRDEARARMLTALDAARTLGIQVKWVRGEDFAPYLKNRNVPGTCPVR